MHPWDVALFLWINPDRGTPQWLIDATALVSEWLPAMLVGLMALLAVIRPAWRRALCLALGSLMIAWLAVRGVRLWLPMPRPAALELGIQWVEHSLRPSFPSMHAAGAFAFATALLLARRGWLAWAFVAAAALVALSRVVLGLHFPLDIAVGAMLGGLVARVVERLAGLRWPGRRWRGASREPARPGVADGGAGPATGLTPG